MSGSFPRRWTLSALLALTLISSPLAAQRPDTGPDRPIQVDCTRGGSINAALQMSPERTEHITIEISGFCAEQLVISRKVIIRGVNPATDGITSPASLGNATAMINVHGVTGFGILGSEAVRFEHLSIVNSPGLGLAVNTAQVALADVTISHHANQAMLAFQGGSIYGDRVTIADNNDIGLNAAGGKIVCSDCHLSNNNPGGGPAAASNNAGVVILLNATITGRSGIQAVSGGNVQLIGGSINVDTRAVSAQLGGQVQFQDNVEVTGSVACSVQGVIHSRQGPGSFGLNQLSTGSLGTNQITNGCFLLAGPGTTILTGQTIVSVGAYVGTEGGSAAIVKFNALSCSNGGKVTTTGGNVFVNNVPGIPASCGT